MSRSDNSTKGSKTYGKRGRGFKLDWRRPRVRAERKRAQLALHEGSEPEGVQHRHSALWDRF